MSVHWFALPGLRNVTSLADYLEQLHPLGIRYGRPDGAEGPPVTYQDIDGQLVATVGALTWNVTTGIIRAWPCAGLGEPEAMRLAAHAQHAFEVKPTKRTWAYHRKGDRRWWSTASMVAVNRDGEIGRLIAEHEHRMLGTAVRITNETMRAHSASGLLGNRP